MSGVDTRTEPWHGTIGGYSNHHCDLDLEACRRGIPACWQWKLDVKPRGTR